MKKMYFFAQFGKRLSIIVHYSLNIAVQSYLFVKHVKNMLMKCKNFTFT